MEVVDAEEVPDGMGLPDELSRREDRLAGIKARAAQKSARITQPHHLSPLEPFTENSCSSLKLSVLAKQDGQNSLQRESSPTDC